MAAGRNDSCPCGSGRKIKRCCGVARGPGEANLARAFLTAEAREAARVLLAVTDQELRGLVDQLPDLPFRDLSLVISLPDLLAPELRRFLDAVAEDDPDEFDAHFPPALAQIDTAETRAVLARAVVALREAGRVEPRLAALAVLDLEGEDDALVGASLIAAAAIATGVSRTPGGLLVAAA